MSDWWAISGSLAGGGFAGALLTNIWTTVRARIQPVGQRVDVTPLFASGLSGDALQTTVSVSDGVKSYSFLNLHVAELSVVNRGNRDFPIFRFGFTLAGKDFCIHAESVTPDRHHTVILSQVISPASTANQADLDLKPFNRGDTYTIKLFIVAEAAALGAIRISSPESVRFTDMPSLAETFAAVASSAAVNVGPFVIRFGMR